MTPVNADGSILNEVFFQRCYDEVSQAVEETGGVVNHETAEKLAYLEARTLDINTYLFSVNFATFIGPNTSL